MKKAIVLMSGGMDSTLCAAIAKHSDYEIAGLHLNYGQITQEREVQAFKDICNFYGITEQLIVDVRYFSQIGGSSLTDTNIKIERGNLKSNDIPNTYVPFRNGNILAIAASWAEIIGATAIYIGAVQQDSSGYPDCREEFIKSFEKAINLGTKPGTIIEIHAPLINMTKADIVRESYKYNSPLHLTWSCYQNSEMSCGICDSCLLRLRGFSNAGFIDPLDYISI